MAKKNNNNQNQTQNQNQKNKKYVSPLQDELDLQTQEVGAGVILHHDVENKRLLLDIDYGTRRGLSSSGKTILVANASFAIREKMKLSLNIYDKIFNEQEQDELEKFVQLQERQKTLNSRLKAIED